MARWGRLGQGPRGEGGCAHGHEPCGSLSSDGTAGCFCGSLHGGPSTLWVTDFVAMCGLVWLFLTRGTLKCNFFSNDTLCSSTL